MTDITELAQRMKAAAVRAKTATEEYASGHMSVSVCFAECEEFNRLTDGPGNIITLVDALEKAQGMEAYWKTQCCGITDHCEELQARIAELESRTVKPPVHPTVASENLDDETLQELIEFRRTTFEYHSKEGNKVQTIIHGVTLSALRELQERRKADSEPVAEVLSNRPGNDTSTIDRALPVGTQLYLHAQPVPVVLDEVTAEDCPAFVKYDVTEVDEAWVRGFNACRAATLQASNCRENSNSSTNNFREMLETSTNSPVIPDTWIPVSERMPEREVDVQVYCPDKKEQMVAYLERNELEGYFRFATWRTGDGIYCQPTHWMQLPAAPQEAINALIPLVSRNEREVK
ncbi:DUF551 domain-containing protein [Klebsiella pneumoniae]